MVRPHIVLAGHCPKLAGLLWESGCLLRIGRQEHLEIFLDDAQVSRHHAEVVATDCGWQVRDLESRNGTFLNGTRLGPTPRRLHEKDVLQLGDLALTVVHLQEDRPRLRTERGEVELEAVARRSWQQAVETLAVLDAQDTGRRQALLNLLRAGHYVRLVTSLGDMVQRIIDDLVVLLDAQRGAVVLLDGPGHQPHLRAVSSLQRPPSLAPAYSRTLAHRCLARNESILCADVQSAREMESSQSARRANMASILCVLLRTPQKRLGVLHLDRGPLQPPFTEADLFLSDAIAASVSAGVEGASLIEAQRDSFLQTVTALTRAVELRDHYTGGHTQRVVGLAVMLAAELRLPAPEHQQVQIGATLHDVGKVGIEDAILQKPGKLTDAEFEQIKTHTWKGEGLVRNVPGLETVLPIIRHHHERWDGAGYPDGLAGEQIPLAARVVGVADAFDAMISDRPYRPALSLERALSELEKEAGRQFDPRCVTAFLRFRPKLAQMFPTDGPLTPPLETRLTGMLERQTGRLLRQAVGC